MQNTVVGVVYNTSTGTIAYAVMVGSTDPSPLTPPWKSGQIGSVQTFACATEPPDPQTEINIAVALPPWSNPNATSPGAGLAVIAAPASFDPESWFKWKVSAGQLVEKTKVTLRLSGKQILADSPINSIVQIGNPAANPGTAVTVSLTGGAATLSSPLPSGTPFFIVTSDSNYWSDPDTFS